MKPNGNGHLSRSDHCGLLVCVGRRRCKDRLPHGRSSLASILMAGSNSVFNAPLERKSCRLPMPPSSGSRIHPSRCFCPLTAAPNANKSNWGVKTTNMLRTQIHFVIPKNPQKQSMQLLFEFGVQSIAKIIGTQSGKPLDGKEFFETKSPNRDGPRKEVILPWLWMRSDTKPNAGV